MVPNGFGACVCTLYCTVHTRWTFYDCLNTRRWRRRLIYIQNCRNILLQRYAPKQPQTAHRRRPILLRATTADGTREKAQRLCYTNIFLIDNDENCGHWRNNEITKGGNSATYLTFKLQYEIARRLRSKKDKQPFGYQLKLVRSYAMACDGTW